MPTPTTSDYLNQLKADKQALIDNLKAQGVEVSNNATFTELSPKVLDISGGSFDGFLPTNSAITAAQEGKSSLKVTVAYQDSVSTGTRVFYQTGSYPNYDCQTYIDIENGNVGTITNLQPSTKYYFRCASYIEDEDGNKFFNNSKTAGSKTLASTFIIENGVYIVGQPEDGTPDVFMSQYSGKLYCTVNSHFYKFDTDTATWVLIQDMTSLESNSFSTATRHITSRGIFFACPSSGSTFNSSYTPWYDETNETFTLLNVSQRATFSCVELSNGDIMFFGRRADSSGGTTSRMNVRILKHGTSTFTFNYADAYCVGYTDLGDGETILFSIYAYYYGTKYETYKYNKTNDSYVSIESGSSKTNYGYVMLPSSETDSNIQKATTYSIHGCTVVTQISTGFFNTNNSSAYSKYFFVVEDNTGNIYKGTSANCFGSVRSQPLMYLDATEKYYILSGGLKEYNITDASTTIVDNTSSYTSAYVYKNKIYLADGTKVYVFDGSTVTEQATLTTSSSYYQPTFFEVNGHLYVSRYNGNLLMLDETNNTWTTIYTSTSSNTAFIIDNDDNYKITGIVYTYTSYSTNYRFLIVNGTTIINLSSALGTRYSKDTDATHFVIFSKDSGQYNNPQYLVDKANNTITATEYKNGVDNVGATVTGTNKIVSMLNTTDQILYGANNVIMELPEGSSYSTTGGGNPYTNFRYYRTSGTTTGSPLLIVNGPEIEV